ncbi:MAG TPA: flavodoxin family protein [Candidatus Fimenecus excrementigallinarum]|uniref:Flavodoxin family protein n=1 Tax=Candidatus Fimenecus excrementigallinarum TaxID=2840816 RepID=A0A9D1IFV8_9FIRM|nr:flavodoxin family protein [Candidatus Fimenecus excrementigallinarum]
MNVLVLFGSPHAVGSTAKLCDAFLSGLPKNAQVDMVRLFQLKPTPCNDCGYCKAADGCSKKDLDEFMQRFFAADLVVVASPVYLMSFPAPLKALFDRFQRFYCARFCRGIEGYVQKPKQAVLLLTAGGEAEPGRTVILNQAKRAFSVMNTRICGDVTAEKLDTAPLSETTLRRAYQLAERVQ